MRRRAVARSSAITSFLERYGVVARDAAGRVTRIIEKPESPPSNHAVAGLQFLDARRPNWHALKPSALGESEIYLGEGTLDVQRRGLGFAWLDARTHGNLLDAAHCAHAAEAVGDAVRLPRRDFLREWLDRRRCAEGDCGPVFEDRVQRNGAG